MLETKERARAEAILAKKTPIYRKAYSDRMAWLMAYSAELAYLKFDKPYTDGELALKLIVRALERASKGTAGRIIGAVRKSYEYDYEEETKKLKRSLEQIGLRLVKPLSVNATQAYLACNNEFAVLAFRGTEADRMKDIRADAKATQATCPTGERVHSGFMQQYDDISYQLEMALADKAVKGKPLFITGHSLGGAIATIAARRLDAERRIAACYTFGSPRVGTEGWVAQIKTPIYRIVNSADPVPMVPFSGTAVFWLAKALRAAGRVIPIIGKFFIFGGNWVERTMSGYAHAGNMRFLTNCRDGDFSKAEILYTVSWGRRFLGALNRSNSIYEGTCRPRHLCLSPENDGSDGETESLDKKQW